MKESITEGHKRVAVHAKFRIELIRCVLQKSITERYKRDAVHAKILFRYLVSMRRALRKTITERYKRVAAHAKMLSPQVEASINTMPCSR